MHALNTISKATWKEFQFCHQVLRRLTTCTALQFRLGGLIMISWKPVLHINEQTIVLYLPVRPSDGPLYLSQHNRPELKRSY